MSNVFSPTQERLFLQLFQLLATKGVPGIYEVFLKLDFPTDAIFSSLVNYSLATGTTLQAIKHFIGADFVKNTHDKSFLREGSFASKIVSKYIAIAGKAFLQDVIGEFINQIVSEDKVWDESKKKTQELIQEKLKTLLNIIISPRVQDNCPYSIRFISNLIAENAKTHSPDSKLTLLGDFILVKYFGNAIASPDEYGIAGSVSKKLKKNFSLIFEVLQSFATKVPIDKKKDLSFLNSFISVNQDRVDQFLQALSLPVKQMPETPIPVEFSITDYQLIEKLVASKDAVLPVLKGPDVPAFGKLIQELERSRALELFNSEKLTEHALKLRVVLESADFTYETELEGPGTVVGTLIPGFLKTIDAAKKKIGKREKVTAVAPTSSKVFGSAFADASNGIPKFAELLLHELFLKGLDVEGVFRLAGSTPKVQEYKELINKGEIPDFSSVDINNLCSLLKLYFKELPEPLVTEAQYENFLNISELPEDQVAEELIKLFAQIPSEKKLFCFKLLQVMYNISINSGINKMTAENLGIAFGPSFFYRQSSDAADVQRPITVFKRMIVHFETIFKDLIENTGTGNLVFKRKMIIPDSVRELVIVGKDQIVCGYSKTKLRVWDAKDYVQRAEVDVENTILAILAVEGNIWCATDKAIFIVDPREGQIVGTVERPASCMALAGSSVWAAYALNKSISIIQIENTTNITEIEITEEINTMHAFGSPLLWAGTLGGTIFIYDIATSKLVHTIPNAHKKKVNYFTLLPNKRVASCSDDSTIAVWSETYELVNRIDAHSAKIKKVRAFDPVLRKAQATPGIQKRPIPQQQQPPPASAPPAQQAPATGPPPTGGPPPGRRPPVPIRGAVNVAALQRNIVIPGLVPGGPPPNALKKSSATNPGGPGIPGPGTPGTTSAVFSQERDFFSCSWDKTIKKWDGQDFHLKEQMSGFFADEVSDFIFIYNVKTQNWNMWASGSGLDHSLCIWEIPAVKQQ